MTDPRLRHHRNLTRLNGAGIAIASYPGAGAALLGNILLELALDYVDPYTEELGVDGSARPAADRVDYRRRIAAYARRDEKGGSPGDVRLVKTHLLPQDFPRRRGAVLLVRDPRDTLYSYYHWRLSFSEEGEGRDFATFLDSVHPLGLRPVDDWTRFHQLWSAAIYAETGTTARVHFEDLKSDPVGATTQLIKDLGLSLPPEAVVAAVEASSFEAMRGHEDQNAPDSSRIMRRGKPGEWREWYFDGLAGYFQDPEFRTQARSLGYEV